MEHLCIFSHYDRDDIVDPHVKRYLRALQDSGFSLIVVSTARLSESEKNRLEELGAAVIVRDNIGYDFGSWSVGLERYRPHTTGRLLLANDSVYGPIGSLSDAMCELLSSPADFYGMVESFEHKPHLQSWFLLFEPHVVRSDAFSEIFCRPAEIRTKEQIIASYELEAAERLRAAGYTYRALYAHGARRIPLNPTAYLWRDLIEKDHVPFLKVGTLRDDPVGSVRSDSWKRVVEGLAPDLVPLISMHLARTRTGSISVSWRSRVWRRIFLGFVRADDYFARRGMHRLGACNKKLLKMIHVSRFCLGVAWKWVSLRRLSPSRAGSSL